MIDNELKDYINNSIIPKYLNYDNGHNINHINDVIESSLEIAKNYDVNINMVFVISAYHDIGIMYGRKNHNITSAKYMVDDVNLRKWFNDEQIKTMSDAIEDHRASNEYEPRTIYGKIISEADRIIDVETIIYRTMGYGKANFPEYSFEEHFERLYEHIEQKYGENGYLKLWLKTEKNTKGLKKLRELLKDKTKMKDMCYVLNKDISL